MAKSKTINGLKTLPCSVCGGLYTDIIDPAVNPEKGGYIICAKCLMRFADQLDKEDGQINYDELLTAIEKKKLPQFRIRYGLTQNELAGRMGITPRHLRRIEKSCDIPDCKVVRKIEKKLKCPLPLLEPQNPQKEDIMGI